MRLFYVKKNLAFTLAEMMVVLALFSVVSAATLPVITARQQLNGTTGGEMEGVYEDPWKVNSAYNSISYYNAGTQSTTSAVMVGGQVTEDAASIGYPQLIVRDSHGGGSMSSDDGSQIILLKRYNNTPYYAGRISFPNKASLSNGSIAIGANAMKFETNTAARTYNVAIGSNAMNWDNANYSKTYNVAIGSSALRKGKAISGTIGIGNYAGYNIQGQASVLIGNYAGGYQSDSTSTPTINYGVFLGDKAGSWGNKADTNTYNVGIGTYASYQSKSLGRTSIGYYSGANSNYNLGTSIGTYAAYAGSSSENDVVKPGVFVGRYAGQTNGTVASADGIAIGDYAGASFAATRNIISIGTYAGYANIYPAIAIGHYAIAHRVASNYVPDVPVIIGTYAEMTGSTSGGEYPAVVIGYYAGTGSYGNNSYSNFIGSYAGYAANGIYNSVCIGQDSCYGLNGTSGTSPAKYQVHISRLGGQNNRNLKVGQSHIGDIPNAVKSSSSVAWATEGYDHLLITPLYGSLTASNDSSIVLNGDVISKKSTLTNYSDRRLKENVRPAKYGLKDLRKINIYNYTWKNDETNEQQIGVIAQEMQKVIPEGVIKNPDGYFTVSATWLVYPMVNAIKELDNQVENMQKRVVAYAKEYVTLVERVCKLEKELRALEKENKALTYQVNVAYKKAQSRK